MRRSYARCPRPTPTGRCSATSFDRALLLATDHHRRQLRKGTEIPYVSHLLARRLARARDGRQRDRGDRRAAARRRRGRRRPADARTHPRRVRRRRRPDRRSPTPTATPSPSRPGTSASAPTSTRSPTSSPTSCASRSPTSSTTPARSCSTTAPTATGSGTASRPARATRSAGTTARSTRPSTPAATRSASAPSPRSRSSAARSPRSTAWPSRSARPRPRTRSSWRASPAGAGAASSSAFARPPMPSLNSRMPRPRLRPADGRRLGPRMSSAMTATIASSMGPMLGMAEALPQSLGAPSAFPVKCTGRWRSSNARTASGCLRLRDRVLPPVERLLERRGGGDLLVAVPRAERERPPVSREMDVLARRDVLVRVDLRAVVELEREHPHEARDEVLADEPDQGLPGGPEPRVIFPVCMPGSIGLAPATEQDRFVPELQRFCDFSTQARAASRSRR